MARKNDCYEYVAERFVTTMSVRSSDEMDGGKEWSWWKEDVVVVDEVSGDVIETGVEEITGHPRLHLPGCDPNVQIPKNPNSIHFQHRRVKE